MYHEVQGSRFSTGIHFAEVSVGSPVRLFSKKFGDVDTFEASTFSNACLQGTKLSIVPSHLLRGFMVKGAL